MTTPAISAHPSEGDLWEYLDALYADAPVAEPAPAPEPVALDLDKEPLDFDRRVFGRNTLPLAAYAEPDGFRALSCLPKLTAAAVIRHAPKTFAAAGALYWHLAQVEVWGVQLRDGWVTETRGRTVRMGSRTRPGRAMRAQDLRRHLLGRGFAVGATDSHRDRLREDVGCVRVDVDYESVFTYGYLGGDDEKEQYRAILARLLRRQVEAVGEMGLEARAFTTGSKGYQLVVPLPGATPWPVARSVASSLQSRLRPLGGKDFRTSMDAILRLPGGLHAALGGLGAWIGLSDCSLYSPEDQLRMMWDGFRYSRPEGGIDPEEYAEALRAPQFGETEVGRRLLGASGAEREEIITVPLRAVPDGGRDRARAVWEAGFLPGAFWEWLIQGRGMYAAQLLFGPGAEGELLALARSVPCRSRGEMEKRERTIRDLCASWKWFGEPGGAEREIITVPLRVVDPESAVIAAEVVALLPRSSRSRWKPERARAVLGAVVQALKEGQHCAVPVTLRSISGAAGLPVGRALSVLLRVLEEGGALCAVRGYVRRDGDLWMPGPLWAQTALGQAILDRPAPWERVA